MQRHLLYFLSATSFLECNFVWVASGVLYYCRCADRKKSVDRAGLHEQHRVLQSHPAAID